MARSDSERDAPVVFRHRIVGAAVLVALAVLILPVILNGPAPVAQERILPSDAAGKEGTKLFVSRITPAGESTKPEQVNKSVAGALPPVVAPLPAATPDAVPVIPPKAESKTAAKPAERSSTQVPAPAVGGSPPVGSATAAKSSESKKAGSAAAPAEPGASPRDTAEDQKTVKVKSGWIVQAGVFAQRENADRIAARLKAAGHHPTVGPVSYRGKSYFRVYVGPYTSQDEARRVSVRVGQALREKVAVVAYP